MGDRGNIVIEPDGHTFCAPLFMYTHWNGDSIKKTVQDALKLGKQRWNDGPYLSRIIFSVLTNGRVDETGFGLGNRLCDNEHDLVLVHIGKQTVRVVAESVISAMPWPPAPGDFESLKHKQQWSFEEFLELDLGEDPDAD